VRLRSLRLWMVASLSLVFVGCIDQPTGPAPGVRITPAAAVVSATHPGQIVPDRYIVLFRDDVKDPTGLAHLLVDATGGELLYSYNHSASGFAARLSADAVEVLRENRNVLLIEEDRIVTASAHTDVTWGLDRIDQHDLPLNRTFDSAPTGAGVRVYVIDSGIRTSHGEFGGRASVGYDALGGTGQDCYGHGTHVAATAVGASYGVAKAARAIAVRVLDCRNIGTTSSLIAGVDWVTKHHIKPAVANMSIGGRNPSQALDRAVAKAIAAGVTFVASAGNHNTNACNYSPGRVAEVITVGASTSSDARASYSNIGRCVDLFAPGEDISSAWGSSDVATALLGGTSMAAPYVAGAAALYLQDDPTATPAAVTSALVSRATRDRLTGIGTGSPNLLLYARFSEHAPIVEPPAPCTDCGWRRIGSR
jgi:aqualysin 1